jgi:hypothetical protein
MFFTLPFDWTENSKFGIRNSNLVNPNGERYSSGHGTEIFGLIVQSERCAVDLGLSLLMSAG